LTNDAIASGAEGLPGPRLAQLGLPTVAQHRGADGPPSNPRRPL